MKLTAEMIREAEAHLPSSRNKLPEDRWAWMADFLNAALSDPGKICPCCRTTRDGEIMDHLPAPKSPSVHEGWQLVPVEPTPEMGHTYGRVYRETRSHYEAMKAAIQVAPKPGEGEC